MLRYAFILTASILISISLPAQIGLHDSPFFADNVVIHDQPERNQQNVSFCTAFNGWQYSTYSFSQANSGSNASSKSIDNGVTWNVFFEGHLFSEHTLYTKLAVVTCGNTLEMLKHFRMVLWYDSISHKSLPSISRFNGVTNEFESVISISTNSDYINDATIASDNLFPATGSDPWSLSLVYSQQDNIGGSIIFRASSYGCTWLGDFDSEFTVASSIKYFGKVDLSYGRSLSFPEGRYFVTWEEKDSAAAPYGHIYTAHTTTGFSSPFTTPVRLDDFIPGSNNLFSNPRIACQVSAVDNDSANLTEVILADKFDPITQKYQVVGFYNLNAATSSNFRSFIIGDPLHNNKQSDICFNPYDSTFMVTYFDSTDKKLPYLIKNFNLEDPGNWQVINPGFNNNASISSPNPQINICYDQHQGGIVWSKDNSNNNGVALFDAPFHYYSGINDNGKNLNPIDCNVFPNPANDHATFEFTLKQSRQVEISLYTLDGRCENISNKYYAAGKQSLPVDISNLPAGIYCYSVKSNNCLSSGKITIVR